MGQGKTSGESQRLVCRCVTEGYAEAEIGGDDNEPAVGRCRLKPSSSAQIRDWDRDRGSAVDNRVFPKQNDFAGG
jgi:hypothetical protein